MTTKRDIERRLDRLVPDDGVVLSINIGGDGSGDDADLRFSFDYTVVDRDGEPARTETIAFGDQRDKWLQNES